MLDDIATWVPDHPAPGLPRFQLLGPPGVRTDEGGLQPVAGRRQMLLLSLLGLAPGVPVDSSRLSGALWPAAPPRDPANALQSQVSRLRRVVGASTIDLAGGAYLLRATRDDVDATAFEDRVLHARRMLAGGAYAAARACVHAAHELWTAEPMSDVQDDPTVRHAVDRLTELRTDAVIVQAKAEIALGLHEQTVGALRTLAHEHPLREDVWALLVTALYRSGRTADALRTYRAARRRLVDELGLEPGPALRELERDVLAGAPHLAPPAHPCASHAQVLAGPYRHGLTDLPPEPGPGGPPPGWDEHPATKLFLDRLALEGPDRPRPLPDRRQAADIVLLCRLLGGDPVAVEQAAASLGATGLDGLGDLLLLHATQTSQATVRPG